MNLVKSMTEGVGLVAADWVFEIPCENLSGARQRLAFQCRFIAQGYDVIELLTGELINGFAAQAIGIYAQVPERGDGARINACRGSTSTECFEVFGVGVPLRAPAAL